MMPWAKQTTANGFGCARLLFALRTILYGLSPVGSEHRLDTENHPQKISPMAGSGDNDISNPRKECAENWMVRSVLKAQQSDSHGDRSVSERNSPRQPARGSLVRQMVSPVLGDIHAPLRIWRRLLRQAGQLTVVYGSRDFTELRP
jgi:hypothetical protein